MTDPLPLAGLKVVEFAGLAPGPFAGMVLADFGADVIRIDRPNETESTDILARGKRSLAVSPKTAAGKNILLKLLSESDVLIDPFRPGVLERLGLGPQECTKLNPRLIYARLTGYRRTGPYAQLAGHDINYLALSGVLAMLRPKGGTPFPPMNLLADFAGGGMMCVLGILLALIERSKSGKGQIVEADMVSGTRYVSSFPLMLKMPASGSPYFLEPSGQNILDGGAPFYDVYETKDGKFLSVGALEPKFYHLFLTTLIRALMDTAAPSDALTPLAFPSPATMAYPRFEDQYHRETWPQLRTFLQTAFQARTRDDWAQVFAGTDACVAPVYEPDEVEGQAGTGVPAPSPKLTRTPAKVPDTSVEPHYLRPGKDTLAVLADLKIGQAEIGNLLSTGVVSSGRKNSGQSKL